MKYYLENGMGYGKEYNPIKALQHMFTVLGNGVELNNKGWLQGNYKAQEDFELGEPAPLTWLYPWSYTERYQPFRDVAGCRDKGFKECAKFFLECLEATPDTVKGVQDWKDNIELVRDVLLNTPTIEDEFTDKEDMSKFLDEIKNEKVSDQNPADPSYHSEVASSSVTKKWFFDVQWSDCPESVENEVRYLWNDRELGNDNYVWKATVNSELFEEYPRIYYWLKYKGVPEDEEVIIHWWW